MHFSVGSLVRARGREWVVLPESRDDLLILRPLGGMDDEVTGIYLPLEQVESAAFSLPDPSQIGDFCSCRLLRDAIRLGFRASTGPFRSFAKIGVEPRPYQLVPLLMALKLDPVRLLIADDVGIGKTIEACLILHHQIMTGRTSRALILVPDPLVHQWLVELLRRFNLKFRITYFIFQYIFIRLHHYEPVSPFSTDQTISLCRRFFIDFIKKVFHLLSAATLP